MGDNILKDPLHWLGWIISTVVIIGVFHVFDLHLHTKWFHPVVLFMTIVFVDYIKHKVGLQ